MMERVGLILQGINRIYRVQTEDGQEWECRIKGKILDQDQKQYNPLAAGDFIDFEEDLNHTGKGMILSCRERKNALIRYNKKRNAPQFIAANFDQVICVTSPYSPPFRPRFIDRVAVSVPDNAQLIIVLNKIDQEVTPEVKQRLKNYTKMGYQVICCCATTGEGVDQLRKLLISKHSVFTGQSGVGKSTLLNFLRSDINQKTAEVSEKYNRGRHTTCYAIVFPIPVGLASQAAAQIPIVTDTPGIREIDVYGIEPNDLSHYYRDLNQYQGKCRFNKCLHQNEPGCAVITALEKGEIDEDRYQSYLNLLKDLIVRKNTNEYR